MKPVTKQRDKKTILRVLTNSESESFACERLWFFRYIEGLTSSLTPAPLRQGSLVGRGIEAWVRSGSRMTIEQIDELVLAPWAEARRHHFEVTGDETAWTKDSEILVESRAMLAGYLRHWASDADEWETLAVEAQVARWLVHPITGRPIVDWLVDGRRYGADKPGRRRRRWAFGGKIDRLVRRRSDQRVWLMETKTTKETNLDSYVRKLHFDPQIRGYAWALANPTNALTDAVLSRDTVREDEATGDILRGYKVEGVIYDVLRKAVPVIPQPIKKGDRLPAASTLTTTRELYLQALLRHGFDPDSEKNATQLEALEGVRFFQREAYPFTDVEIEDFGVSAAWRALTMIDAERRPFHPRQTRVCSFLGCPGNFESICMEDGPMARRSFMKQTIRHPELTGDLAEPWVGAERNADVPEAPTEHREPLDHVTPDLFALPNGGRPIRDPTETPDLFADQAGPAIEGASTVDLGAALAAEDHSLETDDDIFGPNADDGEPD